MGYATLIKKAPAAIHYLRGLTRNVSPGACRGREKVLKFAQSKRVALA
jgi:hypothetical protein